MSWRCIDDACRYESGLGVNLSIGNKSGSPTINLSLDFVAPTRVDAWSESRAELVTIRKRFGFCSGTIISEDNLILFGITIRTGD